MGRWFDWLAYDERPETNNGFRPLHLQKGYPYERFPNLTAPSSR